MKDDRYNQRHIEKNLWKEETGQSEISINYIQNPINNKLSGVRMGWWINKPNNIYYIWQQNSRNEILKTLYATHRNCGIKKVPEIC